MTAAALRDEHATALPAAHVLPRDDAAAQDRLEPAAPTDALFVSRDPGADPIEALRAVQGTLGTAALQRPARAPPGRSTTASSASC